MNLYNPFCNICAYNFFIIALIYAPDTSHLTLTSLHTYTTTASTDLRSAVSAQRQSSGPQRGSGEGE